MLNTCPVYIQDMLHQFHVIIQDMLHQFHVIIQDMLHQCSVTIYIMSSSIFLSLSDVDEEQIPIFLCRSVNM